MFAKYSFWNLNFRDVGFLFINVFIRSDYSSVPKYIKSLSALECDTY